ncbi:glutamate receptor ionotropic, kainate 4-like [Panulirus ornatus]|uniref:glutamate receptor ionotropic, kainate 4-like n=1 Tax=Panulirus ornatus TaxID=150431 RepID=UPI003A88AC11
METLAASEKAIDSILLRVSQSHCSVILLLDGSTSASTVFQVTSTVRATWGVGILEVAARGQDANMTQAQLSRVVSDARRLRQLSWCVTVVVVSDDPVFLAAFAQWSLKGRLLVWSTRLLALTRLSLSELRDLHKTFSMMNAMYLILDDKTGSIKFTVYLQLPYTPPGSEALQVASWSPQRGLALTSHLPLFPDKFSKLLNRPTLVVASEEFPRHKAVMKADVNAPGGQTLRFEGHMAVLLEYLAESLNFTYIFRRPPDGTWGTEQIDGSWSGMTGMVSSEEADVGLGPFSVSATRAEVVDFTWPIFIQDVKIMGGRGQPEVDPWSFLLPLARSVWAAILLTLVAVPSVASLLLLCLTHGTKSHIRWFRNTFEFIGILLQQGIMVDGERWWWERLVLGVWMMVTLVLTRSYSGNLMSLLAVRHIPQPYQSLRDVLDDPSVTMIWQGNSTNVQYFHIV